MLLTRGESHESGERVGVSLSEWRVASGEGEGAGPALGPVGVGGRCGPPSREAEGQRCADWQRQRRQRERQREAERERDESFREVKVEKQLWVEYD